MEKKRANIQEMQQMLDIRYKNLEELDLEAVAIASKYIEKQQRGETKQRDQQSINKDLDLNDNWLGLKQLKNKYQQIPCVFKTKDGKRVNHNNRAGAAAEQIANNMKNTKEKKPDGGWICPCAEIHLKQEDHE